MVKQTFSVQLFVQWTTRLMYDDETAAEAAAVVTDAAAVVTAAAAVVIAAAAASHSPESVLLIIPGVDFMKGTCWSWEETSSPSYSWFIKSDLLLK